MSSLYSARQAESAGRFVIYSHAIRIAKLNSNGSFDSSFDGDGKLTIGDPGGRQMYSFDLAIQSDGKLVMGGLVRDSIMAPASANFLVMRRNADGTPDLAFGQAGSVEAIMSPASDQIHAVRIQPDGRIVVGGTADNNGNSDFALARYLSQ